jgi:hypothetical protein
MLNFLKPLLIIPNTVELGLANVLRSSVASQCHARILTVPVRLVSLLKYQHRKTMPLLQTSFADPGCLSRIKIFSIPDLGSWIQQQQ